MYSRGHREPRAISSTLLRSVSAPCPSMIALMAGGSVSASAVARNRVPSSTPAAPSARAAATPRPSAIPPAASTGTGAARSATTGTNGRVDRPRRAPCPPLSVPCATITSAPRSTACLASSTLVAWMIRAAPARRTGSVNGRGSPKDNMTARGRHSSARSIVRTSIAQLWKPTPHGSPAPRATIGSSRASQSASPLPPPSSPSPPPLDTAAARAPPAAPPIGASAIGCRTENNSVNAVNNAIALSSHRDRLSKATSGGR